MSNEKPQRLQIFAKLLEMVKDKPVQFVALLIFIILVILIKAYFGG